MRLNVSAWSIRKPIPAAVAVVVLMLLGLFSFRSMPITQFPNIDIPIVQVLITQSGAAPSEDPASPSASATPIGAARPTDDMTRTSPQ